MTREQTRCSGTVAALVAFVAMVAAGLATVRPARAAGEPVDAVAPLVDSIAAALDARVAPTLARIDGTGRRLLALRSYLRARNHLAERWSWTAEQIAAYEGSAEQRELQAEVERVRAAFLQANPGFELWVNPQVRSLDVQLEHWNSNESVGEAAAVLLAAVRELAGSASFPASRPDAARKAVEALLTAFVPEPTPTVAAPGLSPHGQMRAIDFQVHQGDRIVAGPKTSSIATEWDAAGWTVRLGDAVRSGSGRFLGPLASPREPWHYTYSPEAVAAR